MNTAEFTVPEGLLEAVAQYLSTRPYAEVHNLMDGIRHIEPVKADEPEAE